MAFRINFNEEKNQLLKATRGICFDDVVIAIREGRTLADIRHKKRPQQKILVIIIAEYIYAVPYVKNNQKQEIFLKTVYPSRTLTHKYLKGAKHEKTKNK
jgi:hypothetical protein